MDVKGLLLVLMCLINGYWGTLSKSDKKAKGKIKSEQGTTDISVYTKNLVSINLKAKDILKNYNSYFKDTKQRNFNGPVLGYVTPWNSHGYDVAKTFGNKLNLVSPVWLQVAVDKHGDYFVGGEQDIDQNWIRDVKKSGNSIQTKMVPRILFDKWSGQDYSTLFRDESKLAKLGDLLVSTVEKHKFDGLVVEVWSQLGGQAKTHLCNVIKNLSSRLQRAGMIFVLVIPPVVYQGDQPGMFDQHDLQQVVDDVDYLSLMTYDYSSPQRPGPNSPIKWVRKCVEKLDPDGFHRSKILLGLNFYGFDYTSQGGGHIINKPFIELLEKFPTTKFQYDAVSGEHFAEIKSQTTKHTVFYPSLHSIQIRLKLAEELGTGVSIWEIGQGLDYFYDLF